jgi:hypothetical protein
MIPLGGVYMKSNATKLLSSALMGILIVLIALDAFLLVTSPFWLNALYQTGSAGYSRFGETVSVLMPMGTHIFMQVFVALSGLTLGAILLEAIRLLMSVQKGNPFCMSNARSLKRSGWLSLAQMALFAAKMANGPTVLTLGCAGIFLVAAMLYFVLAGVFQAAALLREDHDLTI